MRGLRLHGVDAVEFAVQAGECVCISGPSGAGKSLLLRAIADMEPHEGEVYLDGIPSRAIEPPLWRRQVAMLPAESAWWHDGVRAHFPSAVPALASLSLSAALLDAPVDRLSTGERQRLALLRVLANHPAVLLLDEPTASLDPASIEQVERLLMQYRRDSSAALVWVSHDPNQIARIADRHLRIEEGLLHEVAI